MSVVTSIVEKNGEVQNLFPFHEKRNEGRFRFFSHQIHCDAMNEDPIFLGGRPAVYVSVFCDATQVAGCGSTECVVFRMRNENLSNTKREWTHFAVAPILQFKKIQLSAAERADVGMEVYQRFSFLLYESISKHSKTGFRKFR